ncbi:MAG: UDP-glucose 4-epimerase GalE [Planctomycetota bacterium]|jgi:UDP-glucose 4-epimerase|nr:UDP-glucose 4-epimerase GalE [Planctomycetota bacterium]
MAVLVTGGAGYIGSHTVYELLERGREAAVADNLQTGHREAVHPKAAFRRVDIRDRAALDAIFQELAIDSVIHFAANSQVGESMREPLKYYDNNLGGTMTLARVMLDHGVGRIVFSSTAATYGEPERIPILETDRTLPTNPYGETKLAMEKMLEWVANAGGPKFVSLRYFNAAGAHAGGGIGEDHRPETHLIPLVLRAAAGQSDYIDVFGDDYDTRDGTCVRDYIHVSDLARAHILALEYLEKGGESDVFNLGNGQGFSVMEIIGAAGKVAGRDIPLRIRPRRAGDPAQLVASNRKAGDVLGFTPLHSDPAGIIASAWKWHSAHPHGFAQA